jgi:membrane protein
MKLLQRRRNRAEFPRARVAAGRSPSVDASKPQPGHEEPRPLTLSKRDYLTIVKRAVKKAMSDHVPNLAAALAYYAFLAIPSALLIALGLFSLFASPDDVTTLVDKASTIMPSEATTLLRENLTQMTEAQATNATLIGIGGLLAVWALGGAMQNLIWALNIAYDREETRSFVKRRLTAWAMVAFALLGFGLSFGLLVLGPPLSTWLGKALHAETLTSAIWWTAQWPLLVGGLLVAVAGIYWLGPSLEHRRWRFLTFGSVVAVLIWLAASAAFAFYVGSLGSYNKTWGALAAVVILLTWFWLSGVALLFGAEIDAEAERSRELRRGEPAEVQLQAPTKA